MSKFFMAALLLLSVAVSAQIETEVPQPYNIKSVSFQQSGGLNVVPVFALGEGFTFRFDDLFGNEANYYYQIIHCDYDWRPSQLVKSEYLSGFDELRIQNYTNSFNTLQIYSHYTLSIPNRQTQLRVSGNYMLKILNEDRDVVFSRKFVLYEDLVAVPLQVKRARSLEAINYMHNMDFAVRSQTIIFQNPLKNVKIMLMQNGRFDTAIKNVKPQYTVGNDLIYRYDKETQFWAGNEFHYFENKDVRAAAFNVAKIDSNGSLYNGYLFPNDARGDKPYTFYPDQNGNFIPLSIGRENPNIEADYVWIYFTLSAPQAMAKDIYINGMFNNYMHTPEYKMDYDEKSGMFKKAIMIKQGFTNFQYEILDKSGKIDNANSIDGNFWQTENNYLALVYYRENNSRYDRVVGKGSSSSVDITN